LSVVVDEDKPDEKREAPKVIDHSASETAKRERDRSKTS
jgi:hypothetical protein